MDSLTQVVLGAGVAEAFVGKKIGNRAILWGAILGTIPDLDVVTRFFLDDVESAHAHRAFTHSFLFFFLAAPIGGWLFQRLYRKADVSWWQWTQMTFWTLCTHALLDAFTTWGTKLFWPFSSYPVAFKTIFVVDPIYTLPFLICVIIAMTRKRTDPRRQRINRLGLILSSAYLLLTVVNKQVMNYRFESSLAEQQIDYSRVETRPAPLNNLLWAGVAETKSGFQVGYSSFLDDDSEIDFRFFEKNHGLLPSAEKDPKIKRLTSLFNGFYIVEETDSCLLVNDLRFGQYTGWANKGGGFVFSYCVKPDSSGTDIKLVPRDQSQADRMMSTLPPRILGQKP